jgi:hypothetical protein
VWNEPTPENPEGVDLALSFLYAEACRELHEKIKETQKRIIQKENPHLVG